MKHLNRDRMSPDHVSFFFLVIDMSPVASDFFPLLYRSYSVIKVFYL